MAALKKPDLNSVTTINRDGSHFVIHPADVKGRFTTWRRWMALVLITIYVLLPWIPVNGYPAVFLDVIDRRFHLFGYTLGAQDLWLLFFLVSGLAFLLFFITAFLGRVWCGWACPQTVFLEHVFRRVERWIDGDATARRQLDKAPLTPGKIIRRVLKHGIFVLLAAAIAHIFLSYFISIPELWYWMQHSPLEHWSAFVFVSVITAVLYFNFAWFREQLCIVICPYGRMQSALLDEHTRNIAYDEKRGEPRGPVSDQGAGDCIDCNRCVQVCPTGIDIRHGIQLECVACANCIDACDQIMDKVNRPRGLIRYASEEELEGRSPRWLRPRTILYAVLLLAGMGVTFGALQTVQPLSANVTRMTGSPFFMTEDSIRNQFQIRISNKSSEVQQITLNAEVPDGVIIEKATDMDWQLGPMEERIFTWVINTPRAGFSGNFPVEIHLKSSPGGWRIERSVSFVGPDPRLLQQQ